MSDRVSMAQFIVQRSRITAIVLLAAAAAAAVPADSATVKKPRYVVPPAEKAPRETGDPIMAIVSIKSQQVTFYDADGWILRAPVSTGVKGRETPAGVFTVLEKNADHHSNLYDDASMPHMQRLTWNGIALHGGPLPGYAASHGCVRMPYGVAKTLFDKTRIGMRVIVSPNDAEPVEMSHAALLVPDAKAIAAAPARAAMLEREATEAAKTADQTKKAAATTAREAALAAPKLPKLERLKKAADVKLKLADRALVAAKKEDARVRAEDRKLKAAAAASKAAARLDAAKADAKAKSEAAAKAKIDAKAAADRKAETAKAATEAKLATVPVSIYISRAAGKLYVRRNTRKPWPDGGEVYDATIEVPVTIRESNRPIGTHVFTAMAAEEAVEGAADGAGLRWTGVTIDHGDSAEAALDRITIPKDVLDRIAPTTLPRSSIVISDEPLSRETNYRTEFVAVLNNQPKGGFITRRPTVAPPVARSYAWDDGYGFYDDPYRGRRTGAAQRRRTYPVKQQGWWW